jgi:hypothetical protein
MKQFIKELLKDMMKTQDGSKPNWWINGLVAIALLSMFIGVITNG